MAAKAKSTAVVQPNLGLFLDRDPIAMHPRMLQDGLNFRIKEGVLSNLNLGWARFGTFQLNGPVTFIKSFTITGGSEKLVIGTYTDIYQYINTSTVSYITPRYEVGTASRSGSSVTGVGTAWLANVKVGDQIVFGAAGVVSTAAAWDTVTSVIDDTHLTTLGFSTIGSGAYTVRKLFTGTLLNIWQYDIFVNASPSTNNELWMTNGIDSIVRWDGSSSQVAQMSPTMGFTAKTLRVYDNMMIFANVVQAGTLKPTDMLNSDVGQPQNAGSLSTGVSAQLKAHPGTEEILRLEPIGDNLVIYSSQNRITLTQFVGSPLLFIFRQISTNIGIVSSNALGNFGSYHEFLGTATQYYFDGASIKPSNNHIWREVLRQQDPSRITISFAFFDQQNADLIWGIPLTGDSNPNGGVNFAMGEHYLEDPGIGFQQFTPYSKRSFPFTAMGYFKRQLGLTWDQVTSQWQNTNFRWNDRFFAASFPQILVGDMGGLLYVLNSVQDQNGVPLTSFVIFPRRALGDGRVKGLLTRVYPFVSPFTNPIAIVAQMSDSAKGIPQINDLQIFQQVQAEGGHFTTHYRRGRFFEIKFLTNASNQPWEIAGYDVDLRPGGKR